ncbi:MAG TPA: zinc-binding dehydrogenase [Candidatus Limnocylindria bacterium]|nr:zinc-binding dehydrogenase [Candidatus Limnocylindria bacterium]
MVDRRFPLEQAVEAISLVDDGTATGKVVLVMTEDARGG